MKLGIKIDGSKLEESGVAEKYHDFHNQTLNKALDDAHAYLNKLLAQYASEGPEGLNTILKELNTQHNNLSRSMDLVDNAEQGLDLVRQSLLLNFTKGLVDTMLLELNYLSEITKEDAA